MSPNPANPGSLGRILVLHNSAFLERVRADLGGTYAVTSCQPSLDALLESCTALSPVVALLDQEFPASLTPAGRTRLLSLPAPFLIVGTRHDAGAAATLLRWGAAGLLHPEVRANVMVKAIGAVKRGEIWLSRAVLSELVKNAFRPSEGPSLTRREMEILDLFSSGVTNQKIADQLCISRATIRWHLRSIYSKLGVSGRDAALRHPSARRSVRTTN